MTHSNTHTRSQSLSHESSVINKLIIIFSRAHTNAPHIFALSLFPFTECHRSRIYFDNYVRDRCREEINNSTYYPATLPPPQQQQQQQHSVATSTSDVDQQQQQINNNNNNNNTSNSNSLVISPPSSLQLHPSSSLGSSAASGTSNQQQQQSIAPSVLYVQRVVSTSQLQQLSSNYGNNSNASNSLTSVMTRNEADCGMPNNNGEFVSACCEFLIDAGDDD